MNKPLPNKAKQANQAVQHEHEWLYDQRQARTSVHHTQAKSGLKRFFTIIGRGLQCQWLNP